MSDAWELGEYDSLQDKVGVKELGIFVTVTLRAREPDDARQRTLCYDNSRLLQADGLSGAGKVYV